MQLKVYRRDNRKRDQRLGRRRLKIAALAVLALVAVVALYHLSGPIAVAARSMRDFVADSRYFAVSHFQVNGAAKIGNGAIVALAGLSQGMNIWSIDAAAIEKKIKKNVWVRRVVVRRDFPRRVVIDVEERSPKAIVAAVRLYYVDSDGVVFKEVEPGESVKYPMLTGVDVEALMAGAPAARRRIREALRLADLMDQRAHSLSEIHFDAPDRLVVYPTKIPVALRMGWGDWEDKLARLERLLALYKGKEERLASLDMGFQDQVVARLRANNQ